MPLLRFPVRNEFALGQPELYKGADREDPKAVLDGVAVAGLVGILRQLGDLAEFAAEVFHGLQEQVMSTASRSHKLRLRVQRIEAALPALEKAVLAQTSHIHFAYTAGSEWHPRLQNEKNHFIYNDLPRFIMDSYEDCRDPPRLHLLDKFDTGGPGSCLKRYSDPTIFKRASGDSIEDVNSVKVQKDKKARKSKRKSSSRKRELSGVISNHGGRMQFTTPIANGRSSPSQTTSTVVNEQPSPSQTVSTVANERPSSSQAASAVSDTQPSPPQAPSTISVAQPSPQTSSRVDNDMMPKLDMGYHTNSLIERSESGCVEFFNLSASMQHEEQESKETSPRFMNCSGTSELPMIQTHAVEDNFLQRLSHEKIASSPPLVTWDEKAETLESRDGYCDIEEVPEMHIDLTNEVDQVIHQANGDQVDILLNDVGTQAISSRNEVEEIESETDNFLDALNTIDSESECYIDCQTKREVEQYSFGVNANEENGMNMWSDNRADFQMIEKGHPSPGVKDDESQVVKMHVHTANDAGHDTSLAGCHATSNISSEVLIQESLHDSLTSEDVTDKRKAQTSDLMTPSGTDCGEVLERPKMESVVSVPSSTGSGVMKLQNPSTDRIVDSVCDSMTSHSSVPSSTGSGVIKLQDPSTDRIVDSVCDSMTSHSESSSIHSIGFWTNGGLLGLEPSKPPDFAASNYRGRDPAAKDSEVGCSPNCINVIKPDDSTEQPVSFTVNPNGMENGHGYGTVKASTLIAALDGKIEKSGDQNVVDYLSPNTIMAMRKPVSPDTKFQSIESGEVNDGGSVRMFGLGNRLLVNGFHSKVSFMNECKSEDVSSVKTGMDLEQRGKDQNARFNRIPETAFKDQFGSGSPVGSYISSPPLQHMKISFNPVDGFETSKLKLKFPDQNHRQESIADLFASFQLVPSPRITLQDVDSDSDDDTFFRSSPYLSDDCLSHYSESNSEQWESGGSPEGKDPELYEAFKRMSSVDSVSSLMPDEEETSESIHIDQKHKDDHKNGAETYVSDPSLDFPSLDASNPGIQEQINTNAIPRNQLRLQNVQEATPVAPPLPPEQWQVSKSVSSLTNEKQHASSESPKLEFDMKLLASIMSHKPQIATTNQPQIIDEAILFRPEEKLLEQPELHKGKEASQTGSVMVMDGKDDFLWQIRSKSFNLRPTVTAKQTAASGATTNVKVTAILEKASAIRQAVGSDDGEEEDNWSDTS